MEKVSPSIPKPYCYEIDYHKIPREYLIPSITQ